MKIENGTLISIDDEDIVDGRFRLPDGVQTIGERVFLDCTGLTHLTIPEGVTIGESAFWNCTGLTHLTIPEGVTIGKGAFAGCASLTHLTISEGFIINEGAFWRCTGLTEVTLNKGLVSIADSAFNRCNQLNKIWIYSDDKAEFERIKGLVPTALQGKCELHPLYQKIEALDLNFFSNIAIAAGTLVVASAIIVALVATAPVSIPTLAVGTALITGGLSAKQLAKSSEEASEDCARSFKG